MKGPCKESTKDENQGGEAAATARQAEALEAKNLGTEDSHFALETEGTQGLGEPVLPTLYLESCHAHSVVPASCLLRQGSASELNLRHRGLGPQGAWALASILTSNLYIKRLDLRDNGLCGAGAEALARVLCKNSIISDVDLSENQIGAAGLQAVCAALASNPAVQKMRLGGNGLEETAARHLAALLLLPTGLKSLDLSYNQLNDLAGEILGPALAENTGLTELNLREQDAQGKEGQGEEGGPGPRRREEAGGQKGGEPFV